MEIHLVLGNDERLYLQRPRHVLQMLKYCNSYTGESEIRRCCPPNGLWASKSQNCIFDGLAMNFNHGGRGGNGPSYIGNSKPAPDRRGLVVSTSVSELVAGSLILGVCSRAVSPKPM